jgi:FdrA protein
VEHRLLDLGEDEYTRGRAHPIIDPRLRVGMLERIAEGEKRPVVLLDVILGDLADPDPAGSLRPALERLRARAIPVIAVLIGAQNDPQDPARQRAALQEAGCSVFSSNAEAAWVAGKTAAR